jgi:hypothetical protein
MMTRTIKLNEIAYTEFILFFDIKASYDKIALNIVNGCKSKEYFDINAITAWEKLENLYEQE